jgi:phosphate transport system permease protein
LPEAARNSTHYRVLFLAALALFAITFVVNTAAEIVRQRFRRRAHEL